MIEADLVGKQLGNFVILPDAQRPTMPYSLGQGAFGKVYLGKNIRLESQVAIKFLNLDATQDEQKQKELIALFEKEAKLWAQFKHPNIVHVYDFGIYENNPFLVMEYVSKGNLQQRHADHKPLPIPTVVEYVKQIAGALHVLHQKGIIHRDIKPKNLLITEDERVVLADFGIATSLNKLQLQETSTPRGTIIYSAPEQLRGEAEPRSDQYALGIVVYEWLTGLPPFYTKDLDQLIYMQIRHAPPSLRSRNPSIPSAVEEVVLRALKKEPKDRFPTIQDFAKALEHAVTVSQLDAQAVTLSDIDSVVTIIIDEPDADKPVVDTPAGIDQLAKPTQRRTYLSVLLFILLASTGWGTIAGILLQSWLLAAGAAPLISATFYARARQRGIHAPPADSIIGAMSNALFWLSFFLLVVFSSLAAGGMTFSLSILSFSTIDLNGMLVGPQIYLGLFTGMIVTLLVGIVLALLPRKDEYNWVRLLIFSLIFGLAMLQLLYWILGLGISSLKSTTSFLVGIIALAGTITLFEIRKKL